MALTTTSSTGLFCPTCFSPKVSKETETDDKGKTVYRLCSSCGMVFNRYRVVGIK